MTAKRILFRSTAREKVLRGATALADAVKVTLGPRSRSVLIERKWGSPLVCDDGVTIAKEVELEDPEEDLGARMLRQAAEKTGDAVGDGTSTSTLLAHAIYADGLRNVTAGASAIAIKRSLDRALAAAVAALTAASRPVASRREKEQVAAISAHNEPTIGAMVAIAEGIVPGGGVALLHAVDPVEALARELEGDERTGALVLRKALEAPIRQIAENSAMDGGVVVDRLRRSKGNLGFDAARGEFVDMVEAGIIDPTKVVRTALENAVSVASVLLLTEATVTELRERKGEGERAGEGDALG